MRAFHENLLTALDHTDDEDGVFAALLAASQALGFEHIAYGLQLAHPVAQPQVLVRNNYPAAWQQRYFEAGYMATDPTVLHGQRSTAPLVWDADEPLAVPEFWEEARANGLRHGWAQSCLDGRGVGGMLTLSRSSEPLTAQELIDKDMYMRWLAQAGHLALSRVLRPKALSAIEPPLSAREAEVLKWTAEGKTAQEIGDILSISEPTVNLHVGKAVEKLKVANKTAAVVRALVLGLLN
ncbi:MAG: LuxR family transcriptional regulator [Comamonadaceae bacterium]|nr:MAG: LuxR family transcriptional regulator [Comamonadaceae bacterium]